MKRVLTLLLCGMLVFGTTSMSTYAASLDDVIAGTQEVTVQQEQDNTNTTVDTSNTSTSTGDSASTGAGMTQQETADYLTALNNATNMTRPNETVTKVNAGLSKVISIIVQVLAYAITAGLTLRVILDLCFIALPFTRTFLGNGYAGNAAVGNTMPGGMQQPGMMGGAMGSPGMMGGMNGGMMGGMGGRYGMRGGMMGGMNGGMMGGMQPGMQGGMQPSASGRPQWVSTAALNAVAAEQTPTPDGRARSAIKAYASDMIVTLVAVPILLVLAMSGALTQLGLLLGEAIATGIGALGGMI